MQTLRRYGTIIRLTRYTAKDIPGETLESARLVADMGMEGDFYAQGGERQISFLFTEDRQWMEAQTEPGLCFSRYKENILLDGIPPAALTPGVRLAVGNSVLEISDTPKRCFTECRLFSRGQTCALSKRQLFAKVIRSGLVQTGDRVYEEES